MREVLREQLSKEITRKQFLQFLAGATLTVFGFNNLVSLLSNIRPHAPTAKSNDTDNGFGTRRFGV